MTEYIVIIVSAAVLLLDGFLNFLSKPLLGGVLGILISALSYVIIKEDVVAAIKETKE